MKMVLNLKNGEQIVSNDWEKGNKLVDAGKFFLDVQNAVKNAQNFIMNLPDGSRVRVSGKDVDSFEITF